MAQITRGNGEFFVEKDGEKKAEITYRHDRESDLVIEHTHVSDELAGAGIGKELVAAVVNKARAENKEIIAQCPYALKQLKKNEEYHDVLKTV
ncbi:GNAT family N-acetyltransferase [Bacillus piscicola]|uniref:GNAT family N-acetyltransferase n=1 Tax=Bacillus piscicola TaxID=1632684 RepID=UPI001F09DC40|nr:GNAT family N-acetyltransferase [Bacillus piscicola]